MDFQPIDITDKTILQEQINNTRNTHFAMIGLLDKTYKDINKVKKSMMDLEASWYINGENPRSKVKTDSDYLEMKEELEGLLSSEKIIKENIEFLKQDARLLNSTMYQKF